MWSLPRVESEEPLDEMSMPSWTTRGRFSQNTGTPERPKIGETCLVSWESVEETRARQKSRYARGLD